MSDTEQDTLPDAPNRGLAIAKAIGTDVEKTVINAIPQLEPTDNPDTYHDATTTDLLCPQTLTLPDTHVVFAGTPLLEPGTDVEIKACALKSSNGNHDVRGRWRMKGRDNGQHAKIVDSSGAYILTVYKDANAGRAVHALAVVPASIVDEHLDGRWYGIDRRENTMAHLSWTNIFDKSEVES